MEAISNATSFTSPLANANLKLHQAAVASGAGVLGRVWAQLNIWTVLLTLLLVLATYDQCEHQFPELPASAGD
jgi:hypothetical protein